MIRKHQSTAAVAITLALTASLAPSASADSAPLARAEAVIAATHHQASTTIRPNPDELTLTVPAAGPALASSVAPCGDVCSGHGYGSAGPGVVRVITHGGGFNWGDAGIGAGACVVLLGFGLAGARTATKSRRRHAEQRTIATS